MEDISKKIGELLSDPSAMQQIRELAGTFGAGKSGDEGTRQQTMHDRAPEPVSQTASPDPNMIGMMMKLAPLLSSANRDDDSTRLLQALRPFLHEERLKRLDGAIRLLSIMRLLPLLKGMGLELF